MLESFTAILKSMGPSFKEYAQQTWADCLAIIQALLTASAAAEFEKTIGPEKVFAVCALDVLGIMADALGPDTAVLIENCNIRELLVMCMEDRSAEMRQSAFALVGDFARMCFPVLQPTLVKYMPLLVLHLDPRHFSVCNNASWALGEIAIRRTPADVEQSAPAVMEKLMELLMMPASEDQEGFYLKQNVSITIGRFGLACPTTIGNILLSRPEFVGEWLVGIRHISDEDEKESAFMGMGAMIKSQPEPFSSVLPLICYAMRSWEDYAPESLRALFPEILQGYKSMNDNAFQGMMSTLHQNTGEYLKNVYGV
jgi:transportin-1